MAHLLPYYYGLNKEFLSWRFTSGNHHGPIGSIARRKIWGNPDLSLNTTSNGGTKVSGVQLLLQCCSTSPPSGNELEMVADDVHDVSTGSDGSHSRRGRHQVGFLSNEHGWQVRRLVETEDEMRRVAQIQAEAFYEPSIIFDSMFFAFFQAEVLSGLLYRLRNSPPDRYSCLVAAQPSPGIQDDLVGVVDVTVFRDGEVLQYLTGADEYLYVSGIAVLRKFRRQKVATALLKACEMLAGIWDFKYLVLRAYEDDWGARKLYSDAGYRIVGEDPVWMSWIGRRRRVLMVKMCKNT